MEKTVKIGYIEVAKIARESAGGKAAAATLKAKLAKLQTRIEAKQKQLEKQKKALEEKLEGKSVSERAARGKEFQKKVAEYQKLVRTSEEEMQKAQLKLTSALYTVIKDAASTYAKSHGYLVVVDEKAILYLADKIDSKDLTEEIAASLHEKPAK
jgi:outer membrane protein